MAFTDRLHNRGSISTGYDIDNSVKMEADNSEYLSRVLSSSGNRRTFTISTWRKRSELGDMQTMYSCNVSGQEGTLLRFATENASYPDAIQIDIGAVGTNSRSYTSSLYRDTSAWYHVVLAVDTTQSTATDRFKLYVNGVLITDYASRNNPAQNFDTSNNHAANSNTQHVGAYTTGGQVYGKASGYTADTYHIDGQALAPTEFGEYDEDSGIWKPKEYTGTYGTNGFFLDFSDSANLGDDASGNANNFTENNIAAADQATDTPTNNFVTWLSNGTIFNNGSDNMLFNEGGTRMKRGGGTGWTTHYANMAASSGKWYFEHESVGANNTMMGAIPVDGTTDNSSGRNNHYLGNVAGHGVGYQFVDRYIYQNGSYFLNGGSNPNSGTIVQVALDLDNGKIYFGLDNTWLNQQTGSNPSTGSNGLSLAGWSSDQMWMFAGSSYNPNVNQSTNFGGYTEMSISSAANDENGYGTFEYAPPTGFLAMCSKNLAEYGG